MKPVVLSSFFNPTQSKVLYNNYLKFKECLNKQGIEPRMVEVVLRPNKPQIPDTLHYYTDSILWYKEPSINLLVQSLPKEIDKVVWMDADITILDDNWLQRVDDLLDFHPILQVVGYMCDTTKDGTFRYCNEGFIKHKLSIKGSVDWSTYTKLNNTMPGGVWAAKRSFFDHVGLIDKMVIGSGDTILAYGLFGITYNLVMSKLNASVRAYCSDYADKCYKYAIGDVGYLDVEIKHFPHGAMANRQYTGRHICILDIDLEEDLYYNQQGLIEWKRDCESKLLTKHYFWGRQEDDSDY